MVTVARRSDYDLCLLGPLRVAVDGREVSSLGGPRQIAVLARLMVTPGQVVSMDQLIASVWDGDEPSRPHVAVRSYVSNLRRAIEPNRRRRSADSCLASSPPGYRLAIDSMAVDWVRFQQLVDEARDRVVGGDCEAAVPTVRRALSLWRGEPCSGLPASEAFETHRVRLTALRQTAVELLYESLLHLGQHDAVAAEIEAAIVEDPLRERLTELGMLAFYRVGRQSEALALGRRLRDRLLNDLGIDPSTSIADMELRILNHDPTLEPTPGHANPFSAIITGPVPDPAVQPSPDLGGISSPAAAGPGAVPAAAPTGRGHGPVVGRSEVRQRLAGLELAPRQGRVAAAAIVGEPGIGKTTVARELVRSLVDAGGRAIWANSVSEDPPPLWPWVQVVADLLRDADDGPAARTDDLVALTGLGHSVSALLGNDDVPGSVPMAETILAITTLLGRCAGETPLIVVLEDLHRADRSTVTVLDYAVSTLVDAPVVFLATWRESAGENGPLAASLRSLSRLPGLTRVDLRPLRASEVVELAAAVGRPVTQDEAVSIRRRTDGNPLLVHELLSDPPSDGSSLAPSPNLRALVTDRVDQLHPLALPVLRAAALFRAPFTAEDLRPLHPTGLDAVEVVIAAAVRGQVLEEVEPSLGTYRFRQPIVGEVLVADILSTELRTIHRSIGTHLVASDEVEAAYHLSRSSEAEDRALAARIALDVFHRGSRAVGLPELDACVRNGLTAAETRRRSGTGAQWEDLVTDALGFLSWRARVEDRPDDWRDNAWRSLRAAIEEVEGSGFDGEQAWSPPPTATIPLRGVDPNEPTDRSIDRLERAVYNLVGLPARPAGPGDPHDFMVTTGPVLAELTTAMGHLSRDSPARLAARVHLLGANGSGRSGSAARAKAFREAQRLVSTAKRRFDGPQLAPVLATFVARFSTDLEPDDVELLLDDHAARQPGPAADLLWARHGYPALLSAGRVDAALRCAEGALATADAAGDPLLRAEARFLWTRHLLWAGDLEAAERSIDETAAELATLDLAQPAPLLRQRRILRSLRGQTGDLSEPSGSDPSRPRSSTVPGADRASSAELAFRLADLGHLERAREHLDRMAKPDRIDSVDLAELALLGVAASLVGHQPAARLFHQRLSEAPDQLIVRHDGSAILGPIPLWASFAARGAGRRRDARRLLDAGIEAIRRHGGGVPVQLLVRAQSGDGVPIESQPNLKSARAH